MKKNLILLGMMGVGKTTLGKVVAKKCGLKFFDTDELIEKKLGMKIVEIFEKKGESFFRAEEEKEVLKSLKKNKCIIALGGGAFLNKIIRDSILKSTQSIWLDTDIKILCKRIRWTKKRPLLNVENNKSKIYKLYNKRKNIYKLADHKINCDKLSKINIAQEIIDLYEKN